MEAFSLLKYWRGGGGGGGGDNGVAKPVTNGVATIVTAVTQNAIATETDDDDNDGDGDDDGPFFDLEFAVNEEEDDDDDDDGEAGEQTRKCDVLEEEEDDDEDEDEDEREFKFTLSSGSSNDRTDGTDPNNLSVSPSDDLFFKGKLVPIDSSSLVFSSGSSTTPSDQPNSIKPQFPVSLLKSATKFRVFMLGLKKSKSNNNSTEKSEPTLSSSKEEPKKQKQQQTGKFFTVKFKVEEVPIVSRFTRDNSSRVSSSSSSSSSLNKTQKQSTDNDSSSSSSSSSEEKRFAKEVMQRYLKMVKPLYVRVSRRYGEKLRFSGHLSLNGGSLTKSPSPPKAAAAAAASATATAPSPEPEEKRPEPEEKSSEPEVSEAPASNAKSIKQVNLPAGLRVVCKHLGKSRSASAAAVPVAPPGTASSRRRDDSLLQQQDGIQSAILHCKRSFNAIRDSEASLLSRSASDPSRKSSEVAKV